ncbi:hypothetical protein TanjilG_19839 [Lupinus angustifolius]|uniref:Uncharacterized protein n=1 Tax=Lupinus angustifolius TaxID=3871 RepID=A0A1J7H328_LUPAN|nr:hypothetical protein TanjilG_19839 [Lupinus angustifolius]
MQVAIPGEGLVHIEMFFFGITGNDETLVACIQYFCLRCILMVELTVVCDEVLGCIINVEDVDMVDVHSDSSFTNVMAMLNDASNGGGTMATNEVSSSNSLVDVL